MNQQPGLFATVWMFFWNIIKHSGVYALLRRVYDGISGSWKRSCICSWFRRELHVSGWLHQSVAGKVVRLPITFLEYLQKRFGEVLAEKIEGSSILLAGRVYLHNLLALNLRFLGVALLGGGTGSVLMGNGGVLSLSLLIAGGILSLFDCNVTDWLKHSVLVQFCLRALGVEANFAWYHSCYTQGKFALLLAGSVGLIFGILLGGISPILAVLGVFAIGFSGLVLEKPIAGLYFLVFLAPLMPTMLMAGLSLLCLFSLVVKGVTKPDFQWRFDGIGFLILLFLGIYLVAGVTSFAMVKSLSIWAIYLVFICGYFLVIHLIQTPKQLQNLLTVFVLSGTAVCLYGILQYIFGWNINQAWMDEEMFSDIKMRIYSTLENPNVLGEYILLVLPVSIGLMWTRKDWLQKVVYAGISGMMALALILTFSRGCWVGLLVAAAVFVTFAAGKLWGLALVVLPMLPAVLPESILNRFTSIGDMKDSSTSYRVYIWMGTLAMMRDFWVSGIGMGAEAFKAVYPFYSYNGIVAPHSHNLFLQIMVESGIGGIAVFLLILAFFLKRMMEGYQFGGGKGMPLSTMITAISAGVCGFLVQGMFDNCFYNYRVLLVFWYVLGLGVACTQIAKTLAKEQGND
ncbi:MAG: O-antigen ligase family protein [Clostridia bacterium]|nr:O-antigen ligase family protein [Clostridia bacterium]